MGETLFYSVPPSHSIWSWTLEGLIELTRRLSMALNLGTYLASGTTDIQGHRLFCRNRNAGPGTPSRTTIPKLGCAVVENALVVVAPKIGWARDLLDPPDYARRV